MIRMRSLRSWSFWTWAGVGLGLFPSLCVLLGLGIMRVVKSGLRSPDDYYTSSVAMSKLGVPNTSTIKADASLGMSFKSTYGKKMENMFSGMAFRMSFCGFMVAHTAAGMMKGKEFEMGADAELLMVYVYPNTRVQLMNAEGKAEAEAFSVLELEKVVETFEDVYPPMQKDVIEVMVKELLDSGVIKPSNSPFSSPIVMVKKKDNTWRMSQTGMKQLRNRRRQLKLEEEDKEEERWEKGGNNNKLVAKKSKCVLGTNHVEYLGHVIFAKGVATEPSKISVMQEWPTPTNDINLVAEEKGYKWNDDAHLVFETLKVAMMKAPVLALPDFTQPIVVETNASGVGIGAVLQQKVLLALDKWMGYLLDMHFIIKTNHFSLKYLLDQRTTTPTQMKWLPKLMGFDYEVIYKKGSENGAANALSRVQTTELFNLVTTLITNDLAKNIKNSLLEDEKL
ncbi:putative mitochondrial protein [Tanacetum coccineum]